MARIGRRQPRPEEPRPVRPEEPRPGSSALRAAFIEDFLDHLDKMKVGDLINFRKSEDGWHILSCTNDCVVEGVAALPEEAFYCNILEG